MSIGLGNRLYFSVRRFVSADRHACRSDTPASPKAGGVLSETLRHLRHWGHSAKSGALRVPTSAKAAVQARVASSKPSGREPTRAELQSVKRLLNQPGGSWRRSYLSQLGENMGIQPLERFVDERGHSIGRGKLIKAMGSEAVDMAVMAGLSLTVVGAPIAVALAEVRHKQRLKDLRADGFAQMSGWGAEPWDGRPSYSTFPAARDGRGAFVFQAPPPSYRRDPDEAVPKAPAPQDAGGHSTIAGRCDLPPSYDWVMRHAGERGASR
jgi:hypothetical protein